MNVAKTMSLGIGLLLAGTAGCKGNTAIDHGEALFRDPALAQSGLNSYTCATCHEATAGEAGDTLLPGATLAGVTNRPHYWGGQELDLLRSVNHCLYYFMAQPTPWTGEEVEARALYAYLEALSEGASAEPAPFEVAYEVLAPPAGDAGRGDGLYTRACLSCHGAAHTAEDRSVDWAPLLPEQFVEAHPSEEYTDAERRLVFVEKVRHGGFIGYGGVMPPFGLEKLSDQELGDIVAFLGLP